MLFESSTILNYSLPLLDERESMHNFIFKNPVQVVFASGQMTQLATIIPVYNKALLTYGDGSAKQNVYIAK